MHNTLPPSVLVLIAIAAPVPKVSLPDELVKT